MKTLDIILNRLPFAVDYIMLKAFLLSLNKQTANTAEFYLEKARKISGNSRLTFRDIQLINGYLCSMKAP